MPKLSKYKAAGRTASSYQKSIGDVNKLGLGLQHAQWKGEEQRSLYGAIGATTANILGIVKEQKMMGELNKLKESAGNLPGVVKESQEYQRGGKIGEILGMGKGSRDVYKSAFTGEELSDSTLYGIGKMESLSPGATRYSDYKEILSEEFPIKEGSGKYRTATESKTTQFEPPQQPSAEDNVINAFSKSDNNNIFKEEIDFDKTRSLISIAEYEGKGGIVSGENWAQMTRPAIETAYKSIIGIDLGPNKIDPSVLAKDVNSYDKFVNSYIGTVSDIIGSKDPREIAMAWYSPYAYKKDSSEWTNEQSKIFKSRDTRLPR